MKHSRILVTVALPLLAMLILAGCNDDDHKIPFNKEKAREHIITMRLADSMRASFVAGRDTLRTLLANDSTGFYSRFDLANAEMFNRDAIIALLDADGAAGVRIYMGRDSGKIKLVLLPVDMNGNDIRTNLLDGKSLTQKAAAQLDDPEHEEEQAVEVGQRCPTVCSELQAPNP
jgi:hypothetical protein